MPSVLDAPEYVEPIETHDLTIEQPHEGGARPGFWHTLAHRITTHLTSTPRERHAPVCHAHTWSRPRRCPS